MNPIYAVIPYMERPLSRQYILWQVEVTDIFEDAKTIRDEMYQSDNYDGVAIGVIKLLDPKETTDL